MEPNRLGGGMYSSISSGLPGLENPSNPHHLHNNNHPQMISYASHHDIDPHPQSKPGYPYSTKSKNQGTLSDEDDPATCPADESSGDPKRKSSSSPWQRMKWTDNMVRLLIMAVYYIGDEAGSEGNNNTDPTSKKKTTGLLQKKGKWKSVSRAMMEKGFYVSPQQCEDKFNDLNKRYKRVNDILGKGTACKVVENQNLLETMDLSPKMKEEVRKLLNSKHLFFREMCAYHNSCGHGTTTTTTAASVGPTAQPSPEIGSEHQTPHHHHQQTPPPPQPPRQQCFHSADNGLKILKGGIGEDEDNSDDDDDDSSSAEDFTDEEEGESVEGGSRGQNGNEQEEEDEVKDGIGRWSSSTSSRKRRRKAAISVSSEVMQQLRGEVRSVFEDGGKSAWEKKQWMKTKVMQLEEQQVRYQMQAYELEKQRLKWARFSGKKEREMERAKLENERKKLENERMVLLVRQKEIELLNLHHHHYHQHSSN